MHDPVAVDDLLEQLAKLLTTDEQRALVREATESLAQNYSLHHTCSGMGPSFGTCLGCIKGIHWQAGRQVEAVLMNDAAVRVRARGDLTPAEEAAALRDRLRSAPACEPCGGKGRVGTSVCAPCYGKGSALAGRLHLAAYLGHEPAHEALGRFDAPRRWTDGYLCCCGDLDRDHHFNSVDGYTGGHAPVHACDYYHQQAVEAGNAPAGSEAPCDCNPVEHVVPVEIVRSAMHVASISKFAVDLGVWGRLVMVRAAVAAAKVVVPLVYAGMQSEADSDARSVLDMAQAWAICPCDEHISRWMTGRHAMPGGWNIDWLPAAGGDPAASIIAAATWRRYRASPRAAYADRVPQDREVRQAIARALIPWALQEGHGT